MCSSRTTRKPDFPSRTAPRTGSLHDLDTAIATCRACPHLVAWREEAARVKRRAFLDWEYWAHPVPGFGPSDAPLGIVGLAPAAHRGNRTGRTSPATRPAMCCTQAIVVSIDAFAARGSLSAAGCSFTVFRLDALPGAARLLYSLKVLPENLLRKEDGPEQITERAG